MRALAFLALSAALSAGPACQTRPSRAPAKQADAGPAAPATPDAPRPPPGPYHVLAPLADTAAFDVCAADADCAVTAFRCCGCAQGGLGAAIARAQAAAWAAHSCAPAEAACQDAPQPTDDPTCRAAARCVNGHCRLTVTAEALPPATRL